MKSEEEFIHETDWIGSNLVFYNEISGEFHHNINNVFEIQSAELDAEGFANYLKYGFSVFGDTPIKGVKFTLPNTRLIRKAGGGLEVRRLPDPILEIIGLHVREESVIEKIEDWMSTYHKLANQQKETVVLPISGGLDSRLLAYFSRKIPNVESFSYGISMNQHKSSEVLIGKKVAEAMNLHWTHIKLGNFHNYLELNNRVYGPSVHAHSMYHFEFYSKIRSLLGDRKKARVLSGIYGDVWAGSWNFAPVLRPTQVKNLAVTHNVEASRKLLGVSDYTTDRECSFFNEFREELKDPLYRVVAAARLKMILIRHLIETPAALGFSASSPFLDLQIAGEMLAIDATRRENRKWQREFLEANCPVAGKRKSTRRLDFNVSDLNGAQKVKVPILAATESTPDVLRNYDLKKISSRVQISKVKLLLEVLVRTTKIPRILQRLRIVQSTFEEIYADYVILYPLLSIFGKVKS